MDFRLPELGEGITEATVVNIPLKAGDTISKGQALVDVETDKASMSLTSESAGTVTEVRVKAGAKVKVGEVLLVLSATGSPESAPKNFHAQSFRKITCNSRGEAHRRRAVRAIPVRVTQSWRRHRIGDGRVDRHQTGRDSGRRSRDDDR